MLLLEASGSLGAAVIGGGALEEGQAPFLWRVDTRSLVFPPGAALLIKSGLYATERLTLLVGSNYRPAARRFFVARSGGGLLIAWVGVGGKGVGSSFASVEDALSPDGSNFIDLTEGQETDQQKQTSIRQEINEGFLTT